MFDSDSPSRAERSFQGEIGLRRNKDERCSIQDVAEVWKLLDTRFLKRWLKVLGPVDPGQLDGGLAVHSSQSGFMSMITCLLHPNNERVRSMGGVGILQTE